MSSLIAYSDFNSRVSTTRRIGNNRVHGVSGKTSRCSVLRNELKRLPRVACWRCADYDDDDDDDDGRRSARVRADER